MADKSAHKAKTRARILDVAASAMRAEGAQGIGVAELMKRAGLTHGGFYAHFASRDDLVAHAIDRMFADSGQMVTHFLGDGADAGGLAGLIDYYLSERHMLARDTGCPLPALSGEAGRMPEAARLRFEAGVNAFRDAIAEALAGLGRAEPAMLATSALSEMVGALALARSMSGSEAASTYLEAARQGLKARLGL